MVVSIGATALIDPLFGYVPSHLVSARPLEAHVVWRDRIRTPIRVRSVGVFERCD